MFIFLCNVVLKTTYDSIMQYFFCQPILNIYYIFSFSIEFIQFILNEKACCNINSYVQQASLVYLNFLIRRTD